MEKLSQLTRISVGSDYKNDGFGLHISISQDLATDFDIDSQISDITSEVVSRVKKEWDKHSQSFSKPSWAKTQQAVQNIQQTFESIPGEGEPCPLCKEPLVVRPGGVSKTGKPYNAFLSCKSKINGSYCQGAKLWGKTITDDIPF